MPYMLDVDHVLMAVYRDLKGTTKGKKQRGKKKGAKAAVPKVKAHDLYIAAWRVIVTDMQVYYVVERAERLYDHFGLRILPWRDDIMERLYHTCRVHFYSMQSCADALEDDELAYNLAYALASMKLVSQLYGACGRSDHARGRRSVAGGGRRCAAAEIGRPDGAI